MLQVNQLSGFGSGQAHPKLIDVLTNLSLTTDLELCLDAGDSLSYSSGQSWLDRSGNGLDFFRGADGSAASDDPTFNGNAGGLFVSEYWSFDGADFFKYDSASEAWMETLHKDAAIFSLAAWIYIASSLRVPIFSTGGAASDQVGIYTETTGTARDFTLGVVKASAPLPLDVTGDTAANNDAWNFVGLSIDENGSNVSHMYINGAVNQVSAADTFDASYTSPSSAAATAPAKIGTFANETGFAGNGSGIAELAVWEGSVISKANFDAIYSQTRGRFGI